jgi:transcription antitermination factor NusG
MLDGMQDWKEWGEAASLGLAIKVTAAEDCRQSNWFAVYTRVNQEKRVADRLEQRAIEFCLPLYRSIRKRSDRRVALTLPLFPGYLFVHIPIAERRRVLEVPQVVCLVGSSSQPVALPREEMERLRKGLSGHVLAEPHRYLASGCRVRIVNGSFEGLEGILLTHKQGTRVVITIKAITRSFTVELNAQDVERI